jgi:hypothetical protein
MASAAGKWKGTRLTCVARQVLVFTSMVEGTESTEFDRQ